MSTFCLVRHDMNVLLKFDYASYVVHIPDGYIENVKMLQADFFRWLYSQGENTTDLGRIAGVEYNVQDVLRFLNTMILHDCSEVAYLIPNKCIKKIHARISF